MTNDDTCPVTGGANTHLSGSHPNDRWWPHQLNLRLLHQNSALSNPMDEDFDYARAFESLDLDAVKRDIEEVMTTSQDWWPADYGHYGPLLHPHGVAQRRHVPHPRRARGRGSGAAALRAAQQLARQREPRQGPPAALAGQAEVRREDLLGRPDGPRGQLRPRVDGLRRPSASAAGRVDVWEPDRRSTGGPRTRGSVTSATAASASLDDPLGRRPDGSHLREPGGSERQPRPARGRRRHPRDLPPHGHERRGDGGAHRRRAHVRQDPRRRPTPTSTSGREPEAAPIEEQGLGWKNSFGTGKGADTITSGLEGAWTTTPMTLEQQLLREPLRLRMGADEEPGRREPVAAERRRRRRTPSPTPTTRRAPRPRRC